MTNLSSEQLRNFELTHKAEIETITPILPGITTKSPEVIKPYLDAILKQLS